LPAKGFYGNNKVVHEEASSGSRVVERSSHHPSSKGLCPGVIKYSCAADCKILNEIGMSTTIAKMYEENIFLNLPAKGF
jgi:hypothetical protein